MNVCRKAMKSLQNRQWIRDTVIDMFGVMCTYNRPDILYLPSTVRYAKPQLKVNEVNFVWCPHLKMHYTPKDGATIEKVFFTIGKDDNHWLACVSDLKEEKNYILDSLKKYKKNDKKIVNFANQIPSTNGYKRVNAISLFPTEVKDVPQQANTRYYKIKHFMC
ncbi:uncharacterized protein LOC141640962 [Silene latifolia]|uniref:uncharacterized protein LOC141640962 n=1 Tax=Silene latifolia TaxID=37657 RepID=UPI003D78B26D